MFVLPSLIWRRTGRSCSRRGQTTSPGASAFASLRVSWADGIGVVNTRMDWLYTKNGVPLRVSDSKVFAHSGKQIGRIRDGRVNGSDGQYVGTIVNDERLIYRSTHSARVSSPFPPLFRAGTVRAHRVATALWGDEPRIG